MRSSRARILPRTSSIPRAVGEVGSSPSGLDGAVGHLERLRRPTLLVVGLGEGDDRRDASRSALHQAARTLLGLVETAFPQRDEGEHGVRLLVFGDGDLGMGPGFVEPLGEKEGRARRQRDLRTAVRQLHGALERLDGALDVAELHLGATEQLPCVGGRGGLVENALDLERRGCRVAGAVEARRLRQLVEHPELTLGVEQRSVGGAPGAAAQVTQRLQLGLRCALLGDRRLVGEVVVLQALPEAAVGGPLSREQIVELSGVLSRGRRAPDPGPGSSGRGRR